MATIFNIQRAVECFLCGSDKIIIEFAIRVEIMIPNTKAAKVGL
ncbi:hypothetical protein BH18THE2_BH18THE2_19510 [soil metagenome]